MSIMDSFPTPARGETVYSIFSRIHAQSGLPITKIFKELTGKARSKFLFSPLPNYIRKLSTTVPSENPWRDGLSIVSHHSELPFYLYFEPRNSYRRWESKLAQTDFSNPLCIKLGLFTYPHGATVYHPRFCLICAKEQTKEFGFAYYRREHQLYGVTTCWKHKIVLACGCKVCGKYPIRKKTLCMPTRCFCRKPITPLPVIDLPKEQLEPFNWYAKQCAYMVQASGTRHPNLLPILRDLAILKGFNFGKRINNQKLAAAIVDRYRNALLEYLGVPYDPVKSKVELYTRALSFSRNLRNRRSIFSNILLIGIFFSSIEEFESTVIKDLKHTSLMSLVQNEPDEYNILKKKAAMSNDFEIESIVQEVLLKDPKASIKKIARGLNLPFAKTLSELRRLKIKVPIKQSYIDRYGEKTIALIRKAIIAGDSKASIYKRFKCNSYTLILIELDNPVLLDRDQFVANKRKIHHRKLLNQFLKNFPNAFRSDVRSWKPGTYKHLMKFDRKWFYRKIPELKVARVVNTGPNKDWTKIDSEKSVQLEHLFEMEFNSNQRPVWLSRSGVLGKVRILNQYRNYPERFPEITAVLKKNLENRSAYYTRKTIWGFYHCVSQGVRIKLKSLHILTGVPIAELKKRKALVIKLLAKHRIRPFPLSYFVDS